MLMTLHTGVQRDQRTRSISAEPGQGPGWTGMYVCFDVVLVCGLCIVVGVWNFASNPHAIMSASLYLSPKSVLRQLCNLNYQLL